MSIYLLLSYVFVISILVLLLKYSQISYFLKIALTASIAIFFIFHYEGLQSLSGLPSTHSPPEKFQLLAVTIQQPQPSVQKRGSIYLWVKAGETEPRAYQIPWSDTLYKKLTQVQKKLKQGKRITGSRKNQQAAVSGNESLSGDEYHFSDNKSFRLPNKK
jgi:hypothetical protein